MIRALLFALALCLVAAPLVPARTAAARGRLSREEVARRKQALEVFKQGRTAYKAGDYDAALKFFRKAQALYEHESLIILALAKTFDRAKQLEQAKNYYRLFLKEAPATDKARASAVDRIAAIDKVLASRPGVLRFRGLPSAAKLEVNGRERQPDADGALELPSGQYEIRVTLANHIPFERKGIALKPGESLEVQVVLARPPDPSTLPHDHTWTWVAGSATALAAMTAGAFALKSFLVASDYYALFDEQGYALDAGLTKHGCSGNPCPALEAEGNRLRGDEKTWRTAAAVSGLTAAGLAAVTAAAYFMAPVKHTTAAPSASLWLAPGRGAATVRLTLRF